MKKFGIAAMILMIACSSFSFTSAAAGRVPPSKSVAVDDTAQGMLLFFYSYMMARDFGSAGMFTSDRTAVLSRRYNTVDEIQSFFIHNEGALDSRSQRDIISTYEILTRGGQSVPYKVKKAYSSMPPFFTTVASTRLTANKREGNLWYYTDDNIMLSSVKSEPYTANFRNKVSAAHFGKTMNIPYKNTFKPFTYYVPVQAYTFVWNEDVATQETIGVQDLNNESITYYVFPNLIPYDSLGEAKTALERGGFASAGYEVLDLSENHILVGAEPAHRVIKEQLWKVITPTLRLQ